MKSIAALIVLFSASYAIARPNTTAMSCVQAQELVMNEGRIVLDTGATGLYDLFFNDKTACDQTGETKVPAYAKTADEELCQVGYACVYSTSENPIDSRTSPHKIGTCTEGETAVWTERDNINDRNVDVTVICRNGKWEPKP